MLTDIKERLEAGAPFFLGAIPEKKNYSQGLRCICCQCPKNLNQGYVRHIHCLRGQLSEHRRRLPCRTTLHSRNRPVPKLLWESLGPGTQQFLRKRCAVVDEAEAQTQLRRQSCILHHELPKISPGFLWCWPSGFLHEPLLRWPAR